MTNSPINPNDNINLNQPTPSSFLDDLRNKKTEAWERFSMLYGRLILFWLKNAGIPRQERQDMLCDIVIAVMESIDNFQRQPHIGSFRSWLKGVVDNIIHDRQRKYQEQNGAHGVYDPDSSVIESPHSSVLQTILKQEQEDNKKNNPQPTSPHALDEDTLFAKGLMQVLGTQFSQRDISIYYQLVCEKKNSTQVAQLMDLSPANVRKIRQRINSYLESVLGDLGDIKDILNRLNDEQD